MIQIQKPLNILLLGDSKVGKTALCQRYVQGKYCQQYEPTHMISHRQARVKINKFTVTLQLIDTKGMRKEKDYSIIAQNIINSDGIFVMYDLTRKSTLDVASFWITQITKQTKNSQVCVPVLLLATKYQQSPLQQISQDECQKFSRDCTTQFTVCSAKNNFNVSEIFTLMAKKILASRPKGEKKSNECIIY